jgi:hypothetical protein
MVGANAEDVAAIAARTERRGHGAMPGCVSGHLAPRSATSLVGEAMLARDIIISSLLGGIGLRLSPSHRSRVTAWLPCPRPLLWTVAYCSGPLPIAVDRCPFYPSPAHLSPVQPD